MRFSFKLLPLAVLAVIGFFALAPGGGARPQPAYANACTGDDIITLRIVVRDSVSFQTVDVLGFRASISPHPISTSHTGSLLVIDNDDHDDFNGLGDMRVAGACATDHTGFPENGYTVSLSLADGSEAEDLNCEIFGDAIQSGIERTAEDNESIVFLVDCDASPTPTVTGTPPTATPTVTGTPTGDTVTLAAVPANPACGSPSFLFATVRNQQGVPLAGQTVTFSASVGSFNPGSGLTVSDGVFSTTFTPPNTGVHEITITATANGKTGTAVVTVSCAAAQATATNTPVPAPPPSIVPPSTGDAGLAGATNAALYAAAALAATLAFIGVLVTVRRDA